MIRSTNLVPPGSISSHLWWRRTLPIVVCMLHSFESPQSDDPDRPPFPSTPDMALSTLTSTGRPTTRFIGHRLFLHDPASLNVLLVSMTDARSPKAAQLRRSEGHPPAPASIAWSFPSAGVQFRFEGTARCIHEQSCGESEGGNAYERQFEMLRRRLFDELSPEHRAWYSRTPGPGSEMQGGYKEGEDWVASVPRLEVC